MEWFFKELLRNHSTIQSHHMYNKRRKMKKFLVKNIVAAMAIVSVSSVQAEENVKHRFFWGGSGQQGLFDENFKMIWGTKKTQAAFDGWLLPDGGSVHSYSIRKKKESGVVRLDANQKEIWRYTAQGKDNFSCQPLPHGGFLLGETAKDGMWMVEIDKDGKEFKRVKVGDSTKDMHHTFRLVRKTPQGTYLGAIMNGNKTHEWDENGKLIRTFDRGKFVAIRLPNGNTLVSAGAPKGNRGAVIEYDSEGNVVWEVTADDIKALGIEFVICCGLQRLPSGNTVISSVKYGKKFVSEGKKVQAFEITPDKKMVWSIPADTQKTLISNPQILDVEGDVYNFGILR